MASTDHLQEIHHAEELVDEVEQTRERLRNEARHRLGVTGEEGAVDSFRSVLRSHGVGFYPLAALGVLGIVDLFQGYGFSVLTPEISSALGIGKGAIAGILAAKTLAVTIAPLPFAAVVQYRARRAVLCIVTGILWSLVALSTGLVTAVWGLVFVLLMDGFTTGSVRSLHAPLLFDSYPPPVRVRVLTYYDGITNLGQVIPPLLVAGLAAWAHLTWRGVFVVMGLISLGAALTAIRLRDPGFGHWDTEQIRNTVREERGSTETGLTEHDVALGFFEIVRRLLLVPTIRRLLIGWMVYGILLIPYQTFVAFFLDERWNLGPGGRGLVSAFLGAVTILVLVLFGDRGERLFRAQPARVITVAGLVLAVGIVFIALAAVVPVFGLMIGFFGGAAALLAVVSPCVGIGLLSVVPAPMRPHAASLVGLALGAGGLIGALFLSGIDRRFGIAGTLVALLVPGVLGALVVSSAGRLIQNDLDRMIDDTLEDEEIRQITASGGHLPMLAARKIDFSYGPIQVLFGVDFTVDDGEMVALLGTNGAGKSTLLKVISGIGLPSHGTIRYRGAEITYLDAERRLRLGITQVPGGRAVFGPMTVVENLRVFGYSMGRDRRAIDAALDRSFDAFPRLAERRNQLASTLSGGEQQMLGLAKALMLQPRLLLIDELSLGLAPVIVGQLLDMVRQINSQGTAVVLVEQSVNIALGLVDHAYFMEKGEIRFDGSSADLLARDDLLRAVFLEGVQRGTES